GKTVTGLFKDDDLGIRLYIENLRICKIKRQSTVKVRFVTFKFPIPSTPSTVTKIKGVEWYLCLEKDQTLTFKHCSAVKNTDYLLTEMTSQKEFELTPGETTLLTVRYNNI
uniref:Uncharacterized protein n=1 Tax=Panagrolaimus sp. ES5 TaxID=591445 RepID=A0AC34GEQ0_9BILA